MPEWIDRLNLRLLGGHPIPLPIRLVVDGVSYRVEGQGLSLEQAPDPDVPVRGTLRISADDLVRVLDGIKIGRLLLLLPRIKTEGFSAEDLTSLIGWLKTFSSR